MGVFFRPKEGVERPFQACFISGPRQNEQHFQGRPVFKSGRLDLPGLNAGTGCFGITERGLMVVAEELAGGLWLGSCPAQRPAKPENNMPKFRTVSM